LPVAAHRDTPEFLGLAFLTQNLIDLGFALHRSLQLSFFMEVERFPPGHAIPQAAADGGGQCRALVMGKVRGRRWRGMEGTKLQHFATIGGE